jgi:streptogrisin C
MHASPLARASRLAHALTVAVVALAATAAAPAFGDALAEDAETLAAQKGGSAAAAEQRLRAQEAAGGVAGDAQRRWPHTFAGSWREDSGALVVAFTRDAARNAAALGRGARGVAAARSLAELERRQDEMIADRELARAGFLLLPGAAGGRYDLGIDEPGNAIVVVLERSSPGIEAAFRARYGDDVAVREGPIAVPEDCTRQDCRYDLRSGLSVNSADWVCSSAFTVRRHDNDNRNLLSAGHCSQDNRYHGGEKYGEVVAQQQSGRVDAERHSVNATFQAKPWIFVDVDHKSRDVLSRGDYAGISVGDDVCKSGQTTGKTCGRVQDKHYSPSYVPSGNDFIKTSYCGKGGDSGAGVYISNKALGVHSGGSDGACSDPGDFSIFGHIEFVQNALNASVVLAQ